MERANERERERESCKRLFKQCLKALLPHGIIVVWKKIKEEQRSRQLAAQNSQQNSQQIAKQKEQAILKQKGAQRAKNIQNYRNNIIIDNFLRTGADGEKYFDFCGAKLPDVRNNAEYMDILWCIFVEVFFIPYFFQDNYSAKHVDFLDLFLLDGSYGYSDTQKNFDVTIQPDDIVIDAGAWIGDFSAYAANKGARVFAFEPSEKTFHWLKQTCILNQPGEIHAFNLALADSCAEQELFPGDGTAGRHLNLSENKGEIACEIISSITLDDFVRQQHLERIDFIKADIEGAERLLLEGAKETLRAYAPKLVLCTYHSPDDWEVLEKMILDINPNYRIVQLRNKLFACVPKAKA